MNIQRYSKKPIFENFDILNELTSHNLFPQRDMSRNILRHDDSEIVYFFNMAGIPKKDLSISVVNGREIKIKGHSDELDKSLNFSISPPVGIDLELASSKLKDGMLYITLPKKEKSIEIQIE